MRRLAAGGVVMGLVLVAVAALGARPAGACLQCSPDMYCTWGPRGAAFCLGGGDLCMMAGKCSNGIFFDGDGAMIQVTLLEAPFSSAPPGGGRIERGAGLAIGREAGRAVLGTFSGAGARVVYSGFGGGDRVTAALRTPLGDGFTLRREGLGRGARVIVHALRDGVPGALLADERLGEDDALVTRVSFGGRPLVLVVQAPTLPRAEAQERAVRLTRALASEHVGTVAAVPPPFEVKVLDE